MCLFCNINKGELSSLTVYRDESCHAFFDKYPVSLGHVLIASIKHGEYLSDIGSSEVKAIIDASLKISERMKKLNPKILGFNYIINDGKEAGQHVPHVHLHVIPRYKMDKIKVLFNFIFSRINVFNYIFLSSKTKEFQCSLAINKRYD